MLKICHLAAVTREIASRPSLGIPSIGNRNRQKSDHSGSSSGSTGASSDLVETLTDQYGLGTGFDTYFAVVGLLSAAINQAEQSYFAHCTEPDDE